MPVKHTQIFVSKKGNASWRLPLASDLMHFYEHLTHQSRVFCVQMSLPNDVNIGSWGRLCELSLARIVIFNGLRGREAERLTVDSFERVMASDSPLQEDVAKCLPPSELNLAKTLIKFQCCSQRICHGVQFIYDSAAQIICWNNYWK